MAASLVFERFTHSRVLALSVTDALAAALHISGEFPPPLGDVKCLIVKQTAPAARDFDPPRVLSTRRNDAGFVLLDGTYTRPDGSTPYPLAAGSYDVVVRSDYYQDQTFQLVWPPRGDQSRVPLGPGNLPGRVDLFPGAAYPLPDVTTGQFQLGPTILRGSLYTALGDPLAGVDVEVIGIPAVFLTPAELPPLASWPFLKGTSDARGNWVLMLPQRRYYDNTPVVPPGTPPNTVHRIVTVRVHYPDGSVVDVPNDVVLGSEHSYRNTALRGQVLGAGGRAIAGAAITTSIGPLTSQSRADGVWFLYFGLNQANVPNVTVTVTLPDGTTASDSTALVENGKTLVVPTFRFS